jgi:hypothetical protein
MPVAVASREQPIPAHWTVVAGRDAYLRENGFTVAAYDDRYTAATFFGVKLAVPNTPRHRWAIMLHDLHHVATGYGTDPVGEGEISAWELRRGLRPLGLYVGAIVLGGALLGLAIAPRRTLAAWRAAPARRSLFHDGPDAYTALLSMSVAELRDKLGVPATGIATTPRALHGAAPKEARGA